MLAARSIRSHTCQMRASGRLYEPLGKRKGLEDRRTPAVFFKSY
jgi:hypothetical protein